MGLLPSVSSIKYSEFIDFFKEINDDVEFLNIGGVKYINTYNQKFLKEHPFKYNICIGEYFTDDDWDMVNYKNRTIIDIGGNVGDTALYFANKGGNVIAFEPVKHLYDLALENLSLNSSLKKNIKFFNKAVGGKRGVINIHSNAFSDYADENMSYDVEVITVNDIIENYDVKPDILKMDCEGCEFEIISSADLSMFNDIIFEHHSFITGKNHKNLMDILEKQGFKINTYLCNASRKSFNELGIIHAFK